MKKTFFKIMRDDFGGPFDRPYETGISFTDEFVAEDYIRTFKEKGERGYFSIRKETIECYDSLEELIKENPEMEIERLKVIKDNLKREIELPFEINFEVNDRIERESKLSLEDINKIIYDVEFDISRFDKENLELYRKAEKPITCYLGWNWERKCAITINDYETLKKLSEKRQKEIAGIDSKIKSVKKEIKLKEIEKEINEEESEM